MCVATREIMDCMFEAYRNDDNEPEFPNTSEPLWILGTKYNTKTEISLIKKDITSRIWVTYRKGFVGIGGDQGPTTDRGWGCMLRCGQMVLAQAILFIHLGRDWRWDSNTKDPTYLRVIKKFEDTRQAPFSIHQIALMGDSEGKPVGEWFGPNTVAQALKKLVVYDEWSHINIHVALDSMIIISEIRELSLIRENKKSKGKWKPLILIVPLRLGLSEMNTIYVNAIKKCFKFRQSLGIIGGTPNHALYFIGCIGDEVIFLDPHTTQLCGNVENKRTEEQIELDETYHCKKVLRMKITAMDPSVAVCFHCKTEEDFKELIKKVKEDLIKPERQALFEVCDTPPQGYTPVYGPCECSHSTKQESGASNPDRQYDSDEFEIL